ncbi:hypothetical protein E6H12_00735 [Candidatus Bathyarchaeota archaeon]|nr:MAG: hypothetical protein E6H12_00735 [Candidatus Bathyarchaeota archaeon]
MRVSGYIVLTSLLLLAVGIEALSAVEWAAYPYFPDKSLFFAKMDATLFSVLAPFSPEFVIILLYIWVAKLGASFDNKSSKRLKSYFSQLAQSLSYLRPRISSDSVNRFALTDRPRLLLGLAMIMAVLLGLIPYRPELNPAMTPVGVDAHYYIEWVNAMLQRSPEGAFAYALGSASFGSRPLLLIPIYLVVGTGMISTVQAVEFLPAVLGPLLALSTFLFVREGQQTERMAGVVSLLSIFSFNVTVGLWAGFYANWLAVAEAYLFLATLMSFFKSATKSKFVIMTALSLSMLLTHPWTGVMVLTVAAVFVVSVWRDARKTILAKPILLFLAINIVVDVAKSLFFGGLAAAQDVSGGLSGGSFSQTLGFWTNITSALFVYFDGLLANAILLGFSLIAMLFIGFHDKFERLLTSWVVIGSLLFPFFDGGGQARFIYDLPIPVLTSIGLLIVIRPMWNKTLHSDLALLLILLLSANYALRTAINLVAAPF